MAGTLAGNSGWYPGMVWRTIGTILAASVGLLSQPASASGQETCVMTHVFYGEEQTMRLLFVNENDASLEFETNTGEWQEIPGLGLLSCEVEETCRGQTDSAIDPSELTPVGVTIALSREKGAAAYAEWRLVNDEVLQWAFLTTLDCRKAN